jgi:hypothetical protein
VWASMRADEWQVVVQIGGGNESRKWAEKWAPSIEVGARHGNRG